jgi:hypothetical protein
MKIMTCSLMRTAILASAAAMGAGILLHLIGLSSFDHLGTLSLIAWYSSFALVVGSPMILLTVLVVSLVPGTDRWFEQCNH